MATNLKGLMFYTNSQIACNVWHERILCISQWSDTGPIMALLFFFFVSQIAKCDLLVHFGHT